MAIGPRAIPRPPALKPWPFVRCLIERNRLFQRRDPPLLRVIFGRQRGEHGLNVRLPFPERRGGELIRRERVSGSAIDKAPAGARAGDDDAARRRRKRFACAPTAEALASGEARSLGLGGGPRRGQAASAREGEGLADAVDAPDCASLAALAAARCRRLRSRSASLLNGMFCTPSPKFRFDLYVRRVHRVHLLARPPETQIEPFETFRLQPADVFFAVKL